MVIFLIYICGCIVFMIVFEADMLQAVAAVVVRAFTSLENGNRILLFLKVKNKYFPATV